MAISFSCKCGKQLRTTDENAGKKVKCPVCGQVLTIPSVRTPMPPARPAPGPTKPAAPEMIHFSCDCGKQIQARAEYAGRRTKCPECGEAMVIPGGPASEAIQATKTHPRASAIQATARRGLRSTAEDEAEDYDEEEERPRRKKGKGHRDSSQGLLIAIAAAAVLLLAGGGVGAYFLFFKESKPPVAQGTNRQGDDGGNVQAAAVNDLDLVPRDAPFFMCLRVAELMNSEAVQPWTGGLAQPMQQMEQAYGFSLKDVERISVVVVNTGDAPRSYFLVGLSKPYDQGKVMGPLNQMKPAPRKKQHTGKEYYLVTVPKMAMPLPLPFPAPVPENIALHFYSDRVIVLGEEPGLQNFLTQPVHAAAVGPLGDALKLAATQDHHLVIGLKPEGLERAKREVPPEFSTYLPILEMQAATLSARLTKQVEMEVHFAYPDTVKAQKAGDVLKAGLADLRTKHLPDLKKNLGQDKESKAILDTIQSLEGILRNVPIEQHGTNVQFSLKADFQTLVAAGTSLSQLAQKMQGAAVNMTGSNNLRQIALGMHGYLSTRGTFPPASQSGLSWRVHILPFIGEAELYKQFNLKEPWDSPHNKPLLARMPKVYAPPPTAGAPPNTTYYQVLVGPDAAFNDKQGAGLGAFKDGTSTTLLVVEAAQPVEWTKPADLAYDKNKPLPRLGYSPQGFFGAFADGTVRLIPPRTDEKLIRGLITPRGGEMVDLNQIP
jgi:hypothetical protein